mgnify:CR=1 FL=1
MTHETDPSSVRLDIDGSIARLTLNRPDQHNALTAPGVARFLEHLDHISGNDRLRVVVLTGTGESTFCAGASLQEMESGRMSGALFDTLTDRIAAVRLPTVCALNGSVYGGGAEIALCCDFRIGADGIRLSVPASKLGVCYPLGGLRRYVERLGLATANRILLAAEELDTEEMQRVGFLTHRVPRSILGAETDALARRLTESAPTAVQAMKQITLSIASGTLDVGTAEALIARCAESEDLKEGLRARREGRSPRFEGR